ncbi:MAG TPA: hypothetical protein VKC64_18920 [Burkholderiales bacterium]|nr:hypothetical protein [Burkholderiales bacterium]
MDVRVTTVLAVSMLLLLAGCASQPQTPEEFRKAVPGAFMGKTETFEVERSFRDVAETFQRRAPECLNMRVKTTSSTSTSYQVIVARYTPTVVVNKDRAELHVQRKFESGVLKVSPEPEAGYYLLVADAYPLEKNRTRVEWFGPSRGHDVLVRAVRSWASGENLGCPDLTKI